MTLSPAHLPDPTTLDAFAASLRGWLLRVIGWLAEYAAHNRLIARAAPMLRRRLPPHRRAMPAPHPRVSHFINQNLTPR